MKKSLLIFLTCAMSLVMVSCGGSSSSDKKRIAELEAQIAELKKGNGANNSSPEEGFSNVSSSYDSDIVGTYEFTDEINNTWTLVANVDNTATISIKDDKETICYGSWEDFRSIDIGVRFMFTDQCPIVYFPAGSEKGSYIYLKDGYIYGNSSYVEAKNPRRRLPINKIK